MTSMHRAVIIVAGVGLLAAMLLSMHTNALLSDGGLSPGARMTLAIEHEDVAFVEALAPQMDVNSKICAMCTPLMLATRGKGTGVLRALIRHHADVNGQNEKGWTALHMAASVGNLSAVEVLLAHGARPDVPNSTHVTPLILAARARSAAVVERLLQAGADPCQRDDFGFTAQMAAADNGDEALSQSLQGEELRALALARAHTTP